MQLDYELIYECNVWFDTLLYSIDFIDESQSFNT